MLVLVASGCSAPEVRAPEPSPSPRELATLGISNAQAEDLSRSPIEQQEPSIDKQEPERIQATKNTESLQQIPTKDIAISFPANGKTTQEKISLTGPGGREILTLDDSDLTVQVLGESKERYRVICLECDANRQFQAGFLPKEYVKITP